MLYDSNGIKVNEEIHDKFRLYNIIEVKDLLENSYILSNEESEVIKNDYIKDNNHFIKIFYKMQMDKWYHSEKELISYKIEPKYIDINQYNVLIQNDSIKEVENKENKYFVMFDSNLIVDGKSTTGLIYFMN